MREVLLMSLLFLTMLFIWGLVSWVLDLPSKSLTCSVGGAIVAGLGCGLFIGAWA